MADIPETFGQRFAVSLRAGLVFGTASVIVYAGYHAALWLWSVPALRYGLIVFLAFFVAVAALTWLAIGLNKRRAL